jgi:hypothetical protein
MANQLTAIDRDLAQIARQEGRPGPVISVNPEHQREMEAKLAAEVPQLPFEDYVREVTTVLKAMRRLARHQLPWDPLGLEYSQIRLLNHLRAASIAASAAAAETG